MSGGNTATHLLAVGWLLMEAADRGATVDEVCKGLSFGERPTPELRHRVRTALRRLRERGVARRDVPDRRPGGIEPDRWFSCR